MNNDIESKCNVLLDSNSPTIVEDLVKAIGANPGDKIQVMFPQFDRTDGIVINHIPKTKEEFDELRSFDKETLIKLGVGIWDKNEKQTHWLYPKEWYDYIPEDYDIVSILNEYEKFKKGVTDNDTRFGLLAYGFIQYHE